MAGPLAAATHGDDPQEAAGGAAARATRGPIALARSLVEGDRPYVLALLGVLALAAAMISGPLQQYRDGHRRLELLQRKQTLLSAEIVRLEQRKADLQDPEQIERLVREQLGYVRPGEIPYVVVTRPPAPPEAFEPADAVPAGSPQTTAGEGADRWYRRLWNSLTQRVHRS